MPNYLEITLDIATALSIMGAAATFFFQMRRQKRLDLETEKWNFLKELAGEIRKYKAEILNAFMDRHQRIVKHPDVIFEQETYKDTAWNDMADLVNVVMKTLTKAYYYAEYDLLTKAKSIATHYQDPRMDITKQVGHFRAGIEIVQHRMSMSFGAAGALQFPLSEYYMYYFLNEVGLRTLGADAAEELPYSEPDELLDLIKSVTDDDYAPREYYKENDRPPRIFDVLDEFADSIVETALSD